MDEETAAPVTLISHASAYGGVATHLNQVSKVLFASRRVGRVLLFCSTKVTVASLSCPLFTYRVIEYWLAGWRFLRPFTIPFNFLRELLLAVRHAAACLGGDLTLISHNPNGFWGFVLLAKQTRYFLLVLPDPSMMTKSRSIKSLFYRAWRGFLHRLVSHRLKQQRIVLIAPMDYAADIWAQYLHIDAKSIQVLSHPPFLKNPCETIICDTQSHDVRLSEWLALHQAGKKLVLSVGVMEWYKNPRAWVDVVRKIQSERDDLFWIWAGDGEQWNEIRASVADVPLVFAPGRLNQKDLKMLYEIGWVFFHPAVKESQGIVVMDALTYGIPVVLNDAEALPGLIEGSKAGLVVDCAKPAVPDEIASYLNALADGAQYQKISDAALALAIARYSYDKWQERLVKLLQT